VACSGVLKRTQWIWLRLSASVAPWGERRGLKGA
jgi:hypothetical protein